MKLPGQVGAGLIEVAVALLVLSVGSLGLARGQLAARQAASEALQRSEAILIASGLMEQVRSNSAAIDAYRFNSLGDISAPASDCGQQSCDSTQWAAWSLWHWLYVLNGLGSTNKAGHAVAGLIAPEACLSVNQAVATLELSWRKTPLEDGRACGESGLTAGVGVLYLAARVEVLDP